MVKKIVVGKFMDRNLTLAHNCLKKLLAAAKDARQVQELNFLKQEKFLDGWCRTEGLRVHQAFGILRLNCLQVGGKTQRVENVKKKFGVEILKLCLNNVELAFYY